jgi:hypothetical protein
MSGFRKVLITLMMTLLAVPSLAAELVMVQEDGCVWCLRWDSEISSISTTFQSTLLYCGLSFSPQPFWLSRTGKSSPGSKDTPEKIGFGRYWPSC